MSRENGYMSDAASIAYLSADRDNAMKDRDRFYEERNVAIYRLLEQERKTNNRSECSYGKCGDGYILKEDCHACILKSIRAEIAERARLEKEAE